MPEAIVMLLILSGILVPIAVVIAFLERNPRR